MFINIRNDALVLQRRVAGWLMISELYSCPLTASVVQWSEFPVTDPEVPGSIAGITRFSEK
jgi:hypothetical protein